MNKDLLRRMLVDEPTKNFVAFGQTMICHGLFEWHFKGEPCDICVANAYGPQRPPIVVESVNYDTGTITMETKR